MLEMVEARVETGLELLSSISAAKFRNLTPVCHWSTSSCICQEPGFDWLKLPTTHSSRCLIFFFPSLSLSAGKLRKQISQTHFYSARPGIYEAHRARVVLSLIPCPPLSFPSLAWQSKRWAITWANALCVSHGWRGQSHGIMWALLRGKVWVQECSPVTWLSWRYQHLQPGTIHVCVCGGGFWWL